MKARTHHIVPSALLIGVALVATAACAPEVSDDDPASGAGGGTVSSASAAPGKGPMPGWDGDPNANGTPGDAGGVGPKNEKPETTSCEMPVLSDSSHVEWACAAAIDGAGCAPTSAAFWILSATQNSCDWYNHQKRTVASVPCGPYPNGNMCCYQVVIHTTASDECSDHSTTTGYYDDDYSTASGYYSDGEGGSSAEDGWGEGGQGGGW